jgi:hypothetical protein
VKTADLLPGARDQRGDVLRLEAEVRGHGRERGAALQAMEDENRRLKLLVAELSRHGEALKAVIQKNGWSLPVYEKRLRSSPASSL